MTTIEKQYTRMKEEKKSKIDQLKKREDDDQDVRTKEMKLRVAQGKGTELYEIKFSQQTWERNRLDEATDQ